MTNFTQLVLQDPHLLYIFSSNSETFVSELPENLEEMCPRGYYMHSAM